MRTTAISILCRCATVVAAACAAGSCGQPPAPGSLDASVSVIRDYAASFHGLGVAEASKRLADGELTEDRWSDGDVGGKQLIAEFPAYQVRVMFFEGKAITTSVQVLSSK